MLTLFLELVTLKINSNSSHQIVELIKRNITKLIWHFSDFSTFFLDFSKFTWKKNKRKISFWRKDPEKFWIKAIGSLVGSEVGRALTDRISARVIAGGEGQGAGEDEQLKAHLLMCLKGWIGDWRGLVGDGAGHGGGGARRWWCSSRGKAGLEGWWALWDQGEAREEVMVVGAALWRRVDGGQSLPEMRMEGGGGWMPELKFDGAICRPQKKGWAKGKYQGMSSSEL